jgi:hypothetical protein
MNSHSPLRSTSTVNTYTFKHFDVNIDSQYRIPFMSVYGHGVMVPAQGSPRARECVFNGGAVEMFGFISKL